MRKCAAAGFLLSVAVAAFAAAAFAQGSGAPGETAPIFRAGTTLVEFTIVATDDRGQPVPDLNPSEVAIVQNGKPQPLAFFRFEGSAFGPDAVEPKRESIAPGLFTNRVEYAPGPARNVTAIVIDTLNTLPEDARRGEGASDAVPPRACAQHAWRCTRLARRPSARSCF